MMKNIFFTIAIIYACIGISSCSKQNTIEPIEIIEIQKLDSSASYKVYITGTWTMPQHTIPINKHFTQFVGLIHGDSCAVYKLGSLATLGVENVAEVGNSSALKAEMDNYIAAGKALSKFFITLPNIVGTDSTIINVNIKNSRISFESMLAPTPDWFVGIDSYNLIQNNKWVSDITIPVYGYDAGTEDGDVFGYANPATVPQQPISLMTPANASVIANGNAAIAPFASVRFVKL
jgi:hypothetical protein